MKPGSQIAVAAALLIVAALLAPSVETVVDALWFGIEENGGLGLFAVRWISLSLIYAVFWGLVAVATRLAPSVSRRALLWTRRFLFFLTSLSALVSLHYFLLVGVSGSRPAPMVLFDLVQALLIAALAAGFWPLAFELRPDQNPARSIFFATLVGLGIALVFLEPDTVRVALAALGFFAPPMDLVYGGRFQSLLPYLAPAGPLLWSAWDSSRGRESSSTVAPTGFMA